MEIWYALNTVVQLLATVGQGGFGDSLISIIFNELILMRFLMMIFMQGQLVCFLNVGFLMWSRILPILVLYLCFLGGLSSDQ